VVTTSAPRRAPIKSVRIRDVDEKILMEKATQLFGAARAEQLRADIVKMAAETADIEKHPLTFEDEP